jgi:hypothetical protein
VHALLLPVNVPPDEIVPLTVPNRIEPVAPGPLEQLNVSMPLEESWPVSRHPSLVAPDAAPVAEMSTLKTPDPLGFWYVPQYAVTAICVEFRLENPPVLPDPVYVPDSTPPLIAPVNVSPPPDKLTPLVAESKVPVSGIVLPPFKTSEPDVCETDKGLMVSAIGWKEDAEDAAIAV